ncbi:MAG: ATP-binding protein [Thermoanaerobaculia bacterium]|nr:ATP-binding protein [Thermoanaerobaculia bacterium]
MSERELSPGGRGLPAWATEMGELFRAGSTGQFILYGAVDDLAPLPVASGSRPEFVSLRRFLTDAMFEPFDVVIHYDRGRGIRVPRGGDHFHRFLKAFDAFQGTNWARLPEPAGEAALDLGNVLPREAPRALELVNRFLRGSQALTRTDGEGRRVPAPLKVAVLVEYAHFIAPSAEALHLAGERGQVLIQLLEWASDPAILSAHVATVLVTDNLTDLHRDLVESPHSAKIQIPLPTAEELVPFVRQVTDGEESFDELSEYDRDGLAERLVGLSRVNVRRLVLRALRNGERLDHRYLTRLRKELIEKQAAGLIEFIESRRTLDDVAGHVEAKEWLRRDAELLRRGRHRALPMGYLLAGRIGTGKTYLVTCLAGEVGVPVVELKNFRDKWVGATEGNLEKIFTILRALGQVIVFVDEADQATGKRESGLGDSGLSGRVYGMLAKEMSNTDNRGKILWIFATSRPDLLEIDLKRQGRLDVHIPLFPPHDPESRHDLFYAMARKVGLDVGRDELPRLPDDDQIGGNEMEGILVRALRVHETRDEGDGRTLAEVVAEAAAEFRPSAHTERLELMDLLAVKECTDDRFLPPRYRQMGRDEVNRRIAELRRVTENG